MLIERRGLTDAYVCICSLNPRQWVYRVLTVYNPEGLHGGLWKGFGVNLSVSSLKILQSLQYIYTWPFTIQTRGPVSCTILLLLLVRLLYELHRNTYIMPALCTYVWWSNHPATVIYTSKQISRAVKVPDAIQCLYVCVMFVQTCG